MIKEKKIYQKIGVRAKAKLIAYLREKGRGIYSSVFLGEKIVMERLNVLKLTYPNGDTEYIEEHQSKFTENNFMNRLKEEE